VFGVVEPVDSRLASIVIPSESAAALAVTDDEGSAFYRVVILSEAKNPSVAMLGRFFRPN
jgi:hypothetical protein